MIYKTDLISTKWASRVGLQPYVNAINTEAMVAFGQFSEPFAVHDFMKVGKGEVPIFIPNTGMWRTSKLFFALN